MTVQDILTARLRELGADGLCRDNCGCSIDDLAPCGFATILNCVPAKKVDSPPTGDAKAGWDWHEGRRWFEPAPTPEESSSVDKDDLTTGGE